MEPTIFDDMAARTGISATLLYWGVGLFLLLLVVCCFCSGFVAVIAAVEYGDQLSALLSRRI